MEITVLKELLKSLDNQTIKLQFEFHNAKTASAMTRISCKIEGINFSKILLKKEIELLS